MRKILISFFLAFVLLLQATPVFAAVECNWVNELPVGSLKYCAGGFSSAADVQSHRIEVGCGANCGFLQGTGYSQFVDLNQVGYDSNENIYYSCAEGVGFNPVLLNRTTECLNEGSSCVVAAVGAAIVTVVTGGAGAVISIPIAATACAGGVVGTEIAEKMGACNVNLQARVVNKNTGATVCQGNFSIQPKLASEIEEIQSRRFELCNQISPTATDQRTACLECANNNGIWTAIGCIRATGTSIATTFITIGLSIAGAVALLMIIAAGFMYSTSKGDPKRTGEARDLITAAVIGLLFIIFSVTILQFIGVQILQIPGFGV